MKLVISQPMKGKTIEQIRKEREEVIKTLEKQGHEIIDSVANDFPEGKSTPVHYLAKSIEFIGDAEGVVFMPGWEDARGCKIEYQIAKEYGKFIKII